MFNRLWKKRILFQSVHKSVIHHHHHHRSIQCYL